MAVQNVISNPDIIPGSNISSFNTDQPCTPQIQFPNLIAVFLQEHLQYRKVYEDWIQVQILRSTALEYSISLTEEDIQAEGDRQRHELKLERAEDTLAWLQSEQVTPDQWEQGIKDKLLRSLMAEHLFAGDIDRIFAENKLNYDRRAVYRLEIADCAIAQELFYQIEDGEINFFEAAYLYLEDEEKRDRCGFEGLLHRWELPKAHATVIFEAQTQQALSPIETETGFVLFWVGRIIPAILTPELRTKILNESLNQWLAAELIRWAHYHTLDPVLTR
jgi:hypothetical protein